MENTFYFSALRSEYRPSVVGRARTEPGLRNSEKLNLQAT